MRIQDYWEILCRRWWIIVLATAITAGSALGFSEWQLRTAPVYRASTQVLFQPARADYGLTQSAKILFRSYVAAMWTTDKANEVIKGLGLFMTAEELKGDVTMAPDESRLVIQIDVDQNDQFQAERIANAWAVQMVQWRDSENQRQRKEDRVYAMQLEPAKGALRSPKRTINTAAGGVFGLLLGTLLVLVLEWLEAGIIYRPQDLERGLGLTVLGVIPQASRTKVPQAKPAGNAQSAKTVPAPMAAPASQSKK